ncbi:MAG: hypothetical protein M3R59_08935, partial [Verrucomicrobiota bacterium]|nr:hypothetical protein [Verrucomicrobiota bacterium]
MRFSLAKEVIRVGRAFSMSVVLCIVAAPFGVAQSSPKSVASGLPRQAKPISEVVVPIPSKIFASLDKFSNANWRLVQRDGLARAKPHG